MIRLHLCITGFQYFVAIKFEYYYSWTAYVFVDLSIKMRGGKRCMPPQILGGIAAPFSLIHALLRKFIHVSYPQ